MSRRECAAPLSSSLHHKIAVLSRRPGRIREIVAIDTPVDARTAGAAALDDIQSRLWQLLRDEAVAADRELNDG